MIEWVEERFCTLRSGTKLVARATGEWSVRSRTGVSRRGRAANIREAMKKAAGRSAVRIPGWIRVFVASVRPGHCLGVFQAGWDWWWVESRDGSMCGQGKQKTKKQAQEAAEACVAAMSSPDQMAAVAVVKKTQFIGGAQC